MNHTRWANPAKVSREVGRRAIRVAGRRNVSPSTTYGMVEAVPPSHRSRSGPYWEASWYQAGDGIFDPVEIGGATVGVQICTEMWMLDVSRQYGLRGVGMIVVPRATPAASRERWVVGGRAAAIVSGTFCLSSNRSGVSSAGDEFGGHGWMIDPDGEMLAVTSDAEPFVTRDVDLQHAAAAKATYPRYVR